MNKNLLTRYEESVLRHIMDYKLRGRRGKDLPQVLKDFYTTLYMMQFHEVNEHE